ncbi:MAG: glycosyltransferase [Acidobacteriota bacterium]|nr:glycosyltransferase [Acidobacteriota bacterium]
MKIISIGLPVFNGDNYLAAAIESLLAQSFENFELIILDNASSDGTEEICRKAAGLDDRITYVRNGENIGAAKNFNKVFHLSNAQYFKWAAHDDICAPSFLEKALNALESDHSAVLAYPKTMVVDEISNREYPYEVRLDTDGEYAPDRFASLLVGHKCFEIFGLIRSNFLKQTKLIGDYVNGDGVLLAELSLVGKFIEIEEFLFFAYKHEIQSMSMLTDLEAFAEWFNPEKKWTGKIPYSFMYVEYAKAIIRAQISWRLKKQCLARLYWSAKTRKKVFRKEMLNLLPLPKRTSSSQN